MAGDGKGRECREWRRGERREEGVEGRIGRGGKGRGGEGGGERREFVLCPRKKKSRLLCRLRLVSLGGV